MGGALMLWLLVAGLLWVWAGIGGPD